MQHKNQGERSSSPEGPTFARWGLDSNTSISLPSKWATRGRATASKSKTVTPLKNHWSLHNLFPFITAIAIKNNWVVGWAGGPVNNFSPPPISTTIILPGILQMILLAFWWNTSACMPARQRTVLKWNLFFSFFWTKIRQGKSHFWFDEKRRRHRETRHYTMVLHIL